jgi:tripartite-type tricarboxylate transporter receptor subunit TctC
MSLKFLLTDDFLSADYTEYRIRNIDLPATGVIGWSKDENIIQEPAMKRFGMVGAVLLSFVFTSAAFARYPEAPIRIIVPYAAGIGSDVSARRVIEVLRRILDQSIIVDNRPGAGGNIGSEAAAKARPDGYTLLWSSIATHAANEFLYSSLNFDPVADFTPIALTLRTGMVLLTRTENPASDIKELVASAKKLPTPLLVASPSTMSSVVTELVSESAGVTLKSVPYSNNSSASTDVMRGDISLIVDTTSGSLPKIRSGQLKPIAISLASRSPSLPDVPTFKESGIDVVFAGWNALYGPAGLSPEIVGILNDALNQSLRDPELLQALARDGVDPIGGSPEDLRHAMEVDRQRFGDLIPKLGLKP